MTTAAQTLAQNKRKYSKRAVKANDTTRLKRAIGIVETVAAAGVTMTVDQKAAAIFSVVRWLEPERKEKETGNEENTYPETAE